MCANLLDAPLTVCGKVDLSAALAVLEDLFGTGEVSLGIGPQSKRRRLFQGIDLVLNLRQSTKDLLVTVLRRVLLLHDGFFFFLGLLLFTALALDTIGATVLIGSPRRRAISALVQPSFDSKMTISV